MVKEKVGSAVSGWLMVGVLVVVGAGAIMGLWNAFAEDQPLAAIGFIGLALLDLAAWGGFLAINPNTAKVLLVFGDYRGTLKAPGFWWEIGRAHV